ncbi:MAG: class I SAM-dependent methyltransferase [Planctomycetes bacterium]|nr:class I SAM-dependent methyltransferase [Planctomycetota bacterium]
MNRERRLVGTNSYSKDLGLDLVAMLTSAASRDGEIAWLDLCCGAGRALVDAARLLDANPATKGRVSITGVDLVASFDGPRDAVDGLQILEANLERWEPDSAFDLVTCVHGLHYVGDKLGLIRRAVSWLRPGGVFLASLDLANVRLEGGSSAARVVGAVFRASGLQWNPRTRILRADGPRTLDTRMEFLGADDAAGPNYTGQPAVNSHYRRR